LAKHQFCKNCLTSHKIIFAQTKALPVADYRKKHFFLLKTSFLFQAAIVSLWKSIAMLQGGYKIRNQAAIHFITFAVVQWVDVFTRQLYRDIVVDSIKYCQTEKGLLLHSWCIMSNHLHLIASAEKHDLSAVLRDFKTFTSKKIISAITDNPKESRKEWMLPVFVRQGEANSRNKQYQFWQQDNHPQELYSPAFMVQKMDYIHNNPVKAGIVERPEHYLYSSARDYYYGRKCGLLDIVFL
jgi:putative transposase